MRVRRCGVAGGFGGACRRCRLATRSRANTGLESLRQPARRVSHIRFTYLYALGNFA
ncbi:protein of unknown function [Burkholderia multivorans]